MGVGISVAYIGAHSFHALSLQASMRTRAPSMQEFALGGDVSRLSDLDRGCKPHGDKVKGVVLEQKSLILILYNGNCTVFLSNLCKEL